MSCVQRSYALDDRARSATPIVRSLRSCDACGVHGSSLPPRNRSRATLSTGEVRLHAALGEVVAFLQPVVSVREREIRLVEALVRGVDPYGRVRLPAELFAEAARAGVPRELEARCRSAALEAYCVLEQTERTPILSINTDSALVLEGAAGAEQLVREVLEHGVSPSRIALEILESALSDVLKVEEFCRAAKRAGFLVALDDVGTGHSNLERIPRLEPDILKIDRQLVHGMGGSYHRREVFRSLLQLSHQIGALAIAEGVEAEADVLTGLALGCDLFQGFYFGRPMDPRTPGAALCDEGRLREAGEQFRVDARRRLSERRMRQRRCEQAVRVLVSELKSMGEAGYENLLREALVRTPFIEALYMLDERGMQLTNTVHRGGSTRQALFQPSPIGADQSLKQYYLMLQSGLERFTSDPYISMASGNFCITMSRAFSNVLGQSYVLCCDLIVPREGI
jgi:EAL domain-containing protein (putative c-di-GMP-specific phosphodiesterase class I)